MACEMLDEDAEEALHRAADGAVDHHRHLLLAVCADIEGAEAFGQVEVDLGGAALPVTADRIAQHVFELGAIEGALARVDRGLDLAAGVRGDLLQHLGHDAFGTVPGLIRPNTLFRPRRELDHDLLEAEVLVGGEDEIVDGEALVFHLLFGAEDVRIVLREAAHAHEAVEGARRLIAVYVAELGQAQRQLAIGAQAVLENLHVAGAVHRLDGEDLVVLGGVTRRGGGKHRLLVPAPVARGFPQRLVEELRRIHLVVVQLGKAAAHVGDQLLEHRPALGVPEHDARTLFLEMEQVHLAAELAVVAFLGLLQRVEIGLEVIFLRPGGAVDTRQHGVLGIAAPVGTGHLHELEGGADLAGRGHVRPAAEITPSALVVELDVLALRNGVDELDLEQLALGAEELLGLVARFRRLAEGLVALDDLAHLLLDRREILRREGLVAEKVVIEAVFDDRADRHLRAGEKLLHRLGQHVGGVMADELKRFRIVTRHDAQR